MPKARTCPRIKERYERRIGKGQGRAVPTRRILCGQKENKPIKTDSDGGGCMQECEQEEISKYWGGRATSAWTLLGNVKKGSSDLL